MKGIIRMKILMVNKFLFYKGGAETYVIKLGEYLKMKGHDVQYFGMYDKSNCVGNILNLYTKNMEFRGKMSFSKLLYPFSIIYNLDARRKMRVLLDKIKPDIVHLNNFNYQITPSIIIEIEKWRKQNNKETKIIFTAHDYQLLCPNHMFRDSNSKNCELCIDGKYLNCIKNKCIHSSLIKSILGSIEGYFWNKLGVYKYIDRIICCSEFIKTKFDKKYIFKNKTIVMHNFINEKNFVYDKKENYILYFGRFSEEKGIKTLLKVCTLLPNINFIFAGTGPLEKYIIGKNIKNVGFKNNEELKTLIKRAKFSIYPSEWYENCPFSIIESQIYGTPVIASNIGGIPELIQNKKNGLLFETGNIIDLKRCIDLLWNDKNLLELLTDNCKKIKYDNLGIYGKKLMCIYNRDDKIDGF